MLPNLSKLLLVPTTDGKRKVSETDDLALNLVSALVNATLQWTTHKARYGHQIYKDTMRHTVVRNDQGGFEVNVHYRFVRSSPSTEEHVTITLPAPFEAPQAPLTQQVDQTTYEKLEQAVWSHLQGMHIPLEDLDGFGPELTNLIKTALGSGPWKGLDLKEPKIRLHRDASTHAPKWHNDARNPLSEEIVTFYVRYKKYDGPLDDERMPRIVQGAVPWVDMEDIAKRVLRAVGLGKYADIPISFNGGPLDSLRNTYDLHIADGIRSGHFTVQPWPKNAFVRVSGTFHAGPPAAKKRPGQPKTDDRKGRIFLSFKTGRTVSESMKPEAARVAAGEPPLPSV